MKIRGAALLSTALWVFILFSGCNSSDKASSKSDLEDDGYPVQLFGETLPEAPSNVAVLSPSLAEIIYDMGYGSTLLGRSEECDYPEAVTELPTAGSILLPDMDVLIKWKPDLVLTQKDPSDSIKKLLKDNGIPFLVIPPAQTYNDLLTVYQSIGKIYSGSKDGLAKGQAYFGALNNALGEITQTILVESVKKPLNAVYITDSFGHVATGDTVIHHILEAAGAINIAENHKEWTAESQTFHTVDIIFCPETLTDKVKGISGFAGSPAVKNKKVYGIDNAAIERQSKRMAEAAREMAGAMYPNSFTAIESSQTTLIP